MSRECEDQCKMETPQRGGTEMKKMEDILLPPIFAPLSQLILHAYRLVLPWHNSLLLLIVISTDTNGYTNLHELNTED